MPAAGPGPLRKAPLLSATSSIQLTRRNVLAACALLWFTFSLYPVYRYLSSPDPASVSAHIPASSPPPESSPRPHISSLHDNSRGTDMTDGFVDFMRTPTCNFSTLDLHAPFSPLCSDKESLLEAMTGGGRVGIDAPYSTRGCDMRWFRTHELCAILSRFEEITVIGDSMLRNLAVAMNVLLRNDLVNGPRTTWQADPDELDCTCAGAFTTSKCVFFSAWSSNLVYDNAPESMLCPRSKTAPIEFRTALEYPLSDDQITDIEAHFKKQDRPAKPRAFVLGHGLWNMLNSSETLAWTEQVQTVLKDRMPYLYGQDEPFPRLFVTPNAAGDQKADRFLSRQGNIALSRFEKEVGQRVKQMGFDHLGTYNMTIQSTSPDGTHGGYRASLTKAMMVYNWLNSLDISAY